MSERQPEDDYFAQIEREKMEKLREKVQEDASKQVLEERRRQFFHRCGKCGGEMTTQVFRGVEIEICPDCGAVLLDQGELQTLAGSDRSGVLTGLRQLFGNPK